MSRVVHDFTQETILDCIDSGLDVFGITVKNVIYFRFKTLLNLERTDIVKRPDAFVECLRNFFGDRSFNVEAAIVASIIEKFHMKELSLSDSSVRAIIEARKMVQAGR